MKPKRAVIIGGGLGGLAAALRLAARGWSVTVCEKGDTFGGKMNYWSEGGYRFDTGPSLITMPWVFEDLFETAGSRLHDHVELIQLHPLAEYTFDDGVRFTYTASLPDWLATLQRLEPRDVDGFFRFMRLGARLFEVSRNTFLRRRPFDWMKLSDLSLLRKLPLRHGWGNYHDTVAEHFHSPHLRQLFDRYPTYVGSSPYSAPATLIVIPYLEYAFGGWYVRGGLYGIIEGLLELAASAAVELLPRARVEQIEHSGGAVKAVRLADRTRLPADVVVMDGDASDAPKLLGVSGERSLPPDERSLSGLVFLLGVKRSLPEIQHHNVYFSADYRLEFAQLFGERRFPDDPTVYVNAPSRHDPSLVPGEGEALFVMANAPANDDDAWDVREINEAWSRVHARLRRSGFPDIESDIAVREVWTPRRIAERYLMPGGAIYGTHSHGWRRTFLRPPNKDRRYSGLYYVGGSSHPGGGTPTVLLSAQIACELIERYERA